MQLYHSLLWRSGWLLHESTALKTQKEVSAYLWCKQILHFVFARQDTWCTNWMLTCNLTIVTMETTGINVWKELANHTSCGRTVTFRCKSINARQQVQRSDFTFTQCRANARRRWAGIDTALR